MIELAVRTALLAWLHADPAVGGVLNVLAEETPRPAAPPWLAITASAAADWSTKDRMGREVRVALELVVAGDDPAAAAALATAVEARIARLTTVPGAGLVSTAFLRSRAERRARNVRAVLIEHRFRLLAPRTENMP